MRYSANHVYLVLGGDGTVVVTEPNGATRVIEVRGAPTLYTMTDEAMSDGTLQLAASPGIDAYAFTFG